MLPLGWDALAYEPSGVADCLPTLRLWLTKLQIPNAKSTEAFRPDRPAEYETCTKHNAILHEGGCIICENAATRS
jgi:hypothetical protein